MNKKTLTLAAGLGALLAGCGGGGGGSGGGTAVPSGAVTLTSDNAQQAAGDAADANEGAVGGGGAGTTLFTGVVTQDSGGGTSVAELIRAQVLRLDRLSGQVALPLATGAVTTVNDTCSGGGSFSATWDDADNDGEFSSGDSFTVTFSGCVEDGATLDGGMSLTGFTLTGDPSVVAPWSLGADVGFDNLSISEGGTSASIDGDVSLTADTPDGVAISSRLSGSSLTLAIAGKSLTLSSFTFDYTEDLNTLAFSLSVSGTLQSTALNGSVTLSTPTLFTGIDINTFPTAGTLQIDGASNSRVSLTATGGDSVQLDIDNEGDGIIDDTQFTTWTALEAL